jgi:hypothetical protein
MMSVGEMLPKSMPSCPRTLESDEPENKQAGRLFYEIGGSSLHSAFLAIDHQRA